MLTSQGKKCPVALTSLSPCCQDRHMGRRGDTVEGGGDGGMEAHCRAGAELGTVSCNPVNI